MHIASLRFERHRHPFGIGEPEPRLTWTVADSTGPQTAYEIEIRNQDDTVTTSRRVATADSVLVPWPGKQLASRDIRTVRVRLWTEGENEPGPWSDPHAVEAGLLEPADWTAAMISPDCDDPNAPDPRPAALLRTTVSLAPGEIESARLYATARGMYELELNNKTVGDHVLTPGWTSYHDRLPYQTYDVTDLLHAGENTWSAHLADGWFRGRLGFNGGNRDIYGERTGLLAQLEVRYTDGRTAVHTTGPDWRSAPGPITGTGLLDGEAHDARREHPTDWTSVSILDYDPAALAAPDGPPVRRIETLAPVSVTTSPSGKTLLDFGQNLVGRLRIRVNGDAGQKITLRHAEVLEDGELCVWPLREATSVDTYILRGGEVEEWEPRFTYHGFRYAEITGWSGSLDPAVVTAVVLHTDMERTGWFECSDPLLNRLHENVRWGMRGNFVEVPTDCPQRDERLGFTGDLQVFAPTGTFLYDCSALLTSWLRNLATDQAKDPHNIPPLISPAVPINAGSGAPGNMPVAGWGDAAVIVPWVLYERYGDLDILRRQYDSMRTWVDAVEKTVGPDRVWATGFQFGDWLDPSAPPNQPGQSSTPNGLVATAYFARSAQLLARTAHLLGHQADHAQYENLAGEIRDAFRKTYVQGLGRMTADTQTAYALALGFDLLTDEEERSAAGQRLAELISEGGHVIGTGFLGTPLLCDALTDTGHLDTAYRLLTERTAPSWLYPVTMGATTIWERWDAIRPDGTVNHCDMLSFNHYATGAVADWMHRTVAGLAPAAPGYREILIRPRPGGGLTWARTAHHTPYGKAEVDWHTDNSELIVNATVPQGTSAQVDLPGRDPFKIGPGQHTYRVPMQN